MRVDIPVSSIRCRKRRDDRRRDHRPCQKLDGEIGGHFAFAPDSINGTYP